MTFAPNVKATAMAACARHCCICHKFCGLKIECHHIVQEADGGEDTLENCIPLCFDCHADMRSYDLKHPRGTKYSAQELKAHRDGWYAKVATGGGPTVQPQHLTVDREVFASFQSLVPYYPVMDYVKDRDFGASFVTEPLEPLHRYVYYSDRVEYEFLDPEMEGARGAFVDASKRFVRALAQNTWPLDGARDASGVPAEWEWDQPDRWTAAVAEINSAADSVESTYKDLVRLARQRLGVAGAIEPVADVGAGKKRDNLG